MIWQWGVNKDLGRLVYTHIYGLLAISTKNTQPNHIPKLTRKDWKKLTKRWPKGK